MQRLREENVRLWCLLQEHGIQIPASQSTTGIPVTTNALPSPHIPVLKAEQRIALFRIGPAKTSGKFMSAIHKVFLLYHFPSTPVRRDRL